MATHGSVQPSPYRASELRDFYIEHDPSKANSASALIGKYDFNMLSAALENKYGAVPEGWPQTKRKQGSKAGKTSKAKATKAKNAKKIAAANKRKQGNNATKKRAGTTIKRIMRRGSVHKGSDTKLLAHNERTAVTNSNEPELARVDHSAQDLKSNARLFFKGSKGSMVGMPTRARLRIPSLGSVSKSSSSNGSGSGNSGHRLDAGPPPGLMNSSGGGYRSGVQQLHQGEATGNVATLQKYMNLLAAGMPPKMIENQMIIDGVDPDLTMDQLTQVSGVHGFVASSKDLSNRDTLELLADMSDSGSSNGSSDDRTRFFNSVRVSVMRPPPPPPFDQSNFRDSMVLPGSSFLPSPPSWPDIMEPPVAPLSPAPAPAPLPSSAGDMLSVRLPKGLLMDLELPSTVVEGDNKNKNKAPTPRVPMSRMSEMISKSPALKPPVPAAAKPSLVSNRPAPATTNTTTKTTTTPAQSNNDNNNNKSNNVADDAILGKYRRMLKAGLPRGAVENSMIRDGVEIALMFGAQSSSTLDITDSTTGDASERPPSLSEAEQGLVKTLRVASSSGRVGGSSTLNRSKPKPPPRPSIKEKRQQSPGFLNSNNNSNNTSKSNNNNNNNNSNSKNNNTDNNNNNSNGNNNNSSSGNKKPSSGATGSRIAALQAMVQNSLAPKQTFVQSSNNNNNNKRTSGFAAKRELLKGIFGGNPNAAPKKEPVEKRKFKWAISEDDGSATAAKAERPNMLAMLGGAPASKAERPNMLAILGGIKPATPLNESSPKPIVAPRENGSSAAPVASRGRSEASPGSLPVGRGTGGPPLTPPPTTEDESTWQEIWSMQYERSYFVNEVSGESIWTEPSVSPHLVKRMDKTSDWLTCWSDQYNRSFYYNKKTEESVWNEPSANKIKTSAPKAARGGQTGANKVPMSRSASAAKPNRNSANPRLFVVAQHNFTPGPDGVDEIALRAGEVIQVLDTTGGDEWWRGKRVRDGVEGLFPAAFTQWL